MSREQYSSPFQSSFNVRPAVFEVLEERDQETVQGDGEQRESMIVSRDDAQKMTWSEAVFPVIGDDPTGVIDSDQQMESVQEARTEVEQTETMENEESLPEEMSPDESAGTCPKCDEIEMKMTLQTEAMEARLAGPITAAVEAMDESVFQMNRQMHLDVVELAKKLAETVIRREVSVDHEILLQTTEEALKIAGPIQAAVIQCHPEDQELITQHLNRMHAAASPQLVDLSVETSTEIERGGCRVRFADGNIDARLESQLSHLADTVKASLLGPRDSDVEE